MKRSKFKILTAMTTMFTMLFGLFVFSGKSYARTYDEAFSGTFCLAENEYEHSPQEWLRLYAISSTAKDFECVRYVANVTDGYYIPLREYKSDGTKDFEHDNDDRFQDCIFDGRDATWCLEFVDVDPTKSNMLDSEGIHRDDLTFRWSLVKGLKEKENIDLLPSDIVTKLTITIPEINNYEIGEESITIYSNRAFTEADKQKLQSFEETKRWISSIDDNNSEIRKVQISYITPDGREFRVVVGNDKNFYLREPSHEGIYTRLTYSSAEDGTLVDGTYHVQYQENDINKKDLDVTAIITSQTDEGIAYINNVEMKADGTKNSEGWYYPDTTNTKVVARDYAFDTYNNTTYNGYVPTDSVKITGERNGICYERPSIEWTFRRKNTTETENADGSVTVVIEYNLPVDKNSIPSDWEPIYDEDGTTVHKIKRIIKKGEDYDKDVTVKRNGSDDNVTTHVTKKWELKKIPQAGEPAFVVAIGAIIVIAVVITRRKLSK